MSFTVGIRLQAAPPCISQEFSHVFVYAFKACINCCAATTAGVY